MENIGGIFVVLVCGLLVAIFMAVLEFMWMMRQTPVMEVREGYLTCLCFLSLSLSALVSGPTRGHLLVNVLTENIAGLACCQTARP